MSKKVIKRKPFLQWWTAGNWIIRGENNAPLCEFRIEAGTAGDSCKIATRIARLLNHYRITNLPYNSK